MKGLYFLNFWLELPTRLGLRTMPTSVSTRRPRVPCPWCALIVGLLSGCSSLPMESYSFQELPRTYIAAKRENPHTLDLHRLASATSVSDAIDRGDVIKVTINAGINERDSSTFPVRINENGVANLPVIGPVELAGLEMAEAEAVISAVCIERELYRSPNVTVEMSKQRTNKIMVVGAVEKPSLYEIPRGKSNLLAAIVAAGGLAKDAGTIVEIQNPVRGGEEEPSRIAEGGDSGVNAVSHSTPAKNVTMQTVKVDLVSATKSGTGQYLLEDGGVVNVRKQDPEPVFVDGLVVKPGRYEYPPGEELRLLAAISMAGGASNPVADKVYVIRRKPNSADTFVVNLKISDAKRNQAADLLLAPGDLVSVEQTPGTVLMDGFRRLNLGVGATLPLTTFLGL